MTGFYVSVIDGSRKGLLAGPFADHGEALALLEAVQTWVVHRKPEAHFFGFGTARVEATRLPDGRLNGLVPGTERTDKS